MPTSPDQIRSALALVTAAGAADLTDAARSVPPAAAPTLLFQATPVVVQEYMQAAAALGLDWYNELRDAFTPSKSFTPTAVTPLRQDFLGNTVAWATEDLRDATADIELQLDEAVARLMPVVEHEIAAALRETVTTNADDDPDSAGWKRQARPDACPFCRMLADKGAVYRRETVRFASHKNCHCVTVPVFGDHVGREVGVIQYEASSKRRTDADRARLRAYLKENYGA